MPEHAPTPWRLDASRAPDGTFPIFAKVKCNDGYEMWPRIVSVGGGCGPVANNDPDGDYRARDLANAQFIVRAVNSHEELVELAKHVVRFYEGESINAACHMLRNAKDALASAGYSVEETLKKARGE